MSLHWQVNAGAGGRLSLSLWIIMNRIYHDRDTSTSDYREKHRDWQPEAAGPPAGFKFRVTVLTVGVAVTAVTHRRDSHGQSHESGFQVA